MTNEDTIKLKMQREQHEHEMKIALMNAFAADPELKYYAGVAVGAGVASIAALFGGVASDDPPDNSKTPWKWLLYAVSPGAAASEVLPGWVGYFSPIVALGQSFQESPPAGSPADLAKNVVAMGGMGFAGFCASILILKAMFGGDEGKGIMRTIGAVIP